jgi:hypothetical protein
MNPERIRIIKRHKRWSDGYALLRQIFVFLVIGGICLILKHFDTDAAARSASFALLAVMVLIAALGSRRVTISHGSIC